MMKVTFPTASPPISFKEGLAAGLSVCDRIPYTDDGENYVWAVIDEVEVSSDGLTTTLTLELGKSPIQSGMYRTEDDQWGFRNRKGQFFKNVQAVDVTTPAEYIEEHDGVLTLYLWDNGNVTWKEPELER